MGEKIVVIGGVAAGPAAASKAKRVNPKAEVSIFTDEGDISYGGCGLPYFIGKVIKERQTLIARTPEAFKKSGVEIHLNSRVEEIDVQRREIKVNGKKIPFDKAIIATGASAIVPPFEGLNNNGIFTLRTLKDGEKILKYLREKSPRNAVVVGAGYIGMEMAEALKEWDVKVTVVELMPQILINMDKDMAEIVEKEIKESGIDVLTSTKVMGFEGDGNIKQVVTDKGKIETDFVLLSIGVKPNSELAREAGIKLGPKGSIDVNRQMETSAEGIYAAGDCADAYHIVTGEKTYIPLGTTANKQGRIAGNNAAGGKYTAFPGVVGTAIAKVLELEIARTGLSTVEAERAGFKVKSSYIKAHTTAHYYPGGKDVHVKLIAEEGTGRLIGAQIVGGKGSGLRIDALSMAVTNGMRIWDFAYSDFAYAPPFSPVWDPVLIAAQNLLKSF